VREVGEREEEGLKEKERMEGEGGRKQEGRKEEEDGGRGKDEAGRRKKKKEEEGLTTILHGHVKANGGPFALLARYSYLPTHRVYQTLGDR
jgi:hypothetical protein